MKRTLSQKGFELANGLPFIATDPAIHYLLDSHSVAEAQQLQIALGKVRQTFGHFMGKIIAIDPQRIKSYTKRQMVRRQKDRQSKPKKMAQTFFCLDTDTEQPLCFTTASSSRWFSAPGPYRSHGHLSHIHILFLSRIPVNEGVDKMFLQHRHRLSRQISL